MNCLNNAQPQRSHASSDAQRQVVVWLQDTSVWAQLRCDGMFCDVLSCAHLLSLCGINVSWPASLSVVHASRCVLGSLRVDLCVCKTARAVRVCESESALAMPSWCDVKCASEQRWSCRTLRKVLSERCRKDTRRKKKEKKRANNIEEPCEHELFCESTQCGHVTPHASSCTRVAVSLRKSSAPRAGGSGRVMFVVCRSVRGVNDAPPTSCSENSWASWHAISTGLRVM
jgi:hypothetical protein